MDGRKNNGGNSTRAKEGKIDKRKNSFRHLIAQTITEEKHHLEYEKFQERDFLPNVA